MSPLGCCFLTFNANNAMVNSSYLARCLTSLLDEHALQPDLIFVALQEVAPVPYSLLSGPAVAPYINAVSTAILEGVSGTRKSSTTTTAYQHVRTSSMNFVVGMLFALPEVASNMSRIQVASTRIGIQPFGTKAAVGIRFSYAVAGSSPTSITFVGTHLMHAEENCEQRNRDWQMINENLVFDEHISGPSPSLSSEQQPLILTPSPRTRNDGGIFRPGSYLFFGGDLNYRTADAGPKAQDMANFPQPGTDYMQSLSTDQLAREQAAGRTLHNLTEPPIDFPPTYKYSPAAMAKAATSIGTKDMLREPNEWSWSHKRFPAWCDRILYTDLPQTLDHLRPEIKKYTCLPIQPTSDHRPVALLFDLPILGRELTQTELGLWPRSVYEVGSPVGWARRAASRVCEIGIGVQAWIVLTWYGRVVGSGLVGAVIAGSWWWYCYA